MTKKKPGIELPFDDAPAPLKENDPRPQKAAQLPIESRRPLRKAEEVIPTSIYDIGEQDEEFRPVADRNLSDPGFRPAFLYVERGPGMGQLVQVKQGVSVIGRASVSELRLQHASISRRHAQLTRHGDRFYFKDLGSQNGSYVNRTKIATEVEIEIGDELALGNALLKLRGPVQAAEAPPVPVKSTKAAPTELKARPSKPPPPSVKPPVSVMKIAVIAAAVGFALAGGLMLVMMRLPSKPAYSQLPEETQPARPSLVAAVDDAKAHPGEADVPVPMADPVAKTPRREPVAATPPGMVAKAEPPAPARSPSRPGPTPRLASSRKAEPVPTPEPEAETPAPSGGTNAHGPAILARYEAGNVQAAIDMARKFDNQELLAKLTRFQTSYEAAGRALAAKDGTGAIKNYAAALKMDEQLSSGWGTYGPDIRKQLANLYSLVGAKHLDNGNGAEAQRAFTAALKYDPENARAKAGLETVGAPVKADDSDEAAAPPKPKKNARSAADEAFGD